MKEKEVWTLDGRKKIFLVDDNNHVIKEVKDLGPLNKTEMLWVMKRPSKPYNEWLEDCKKEQKENNKSKKGEKTKAKSGKKRKK